MTISHLYFDLHVDYATREIVVRGEFDAGTAPCLATAIARLQRVAPGDITVRLDDVTLIDATGLSAVAAANSAQTTRGARLMVTSTDAAVSRAFVVADLDELLQP